MTGAIRRNGARTPEELETLFEDALVMRDQAALIELFDEESVLMSRAGTSVRGAADVARWALATWHGDHPYVADPQAVGQALDLALVVAERSINVARRARDGTWRYAIVHQAIDDVVERRQP